MTSYLVQEAMVSMMMVLMAIVGMVIAVIEKAAAGQKAEMATEKTHRRRGEVEFHHPLLLLQEFDLASPLGRLSSLFGWWQG